MFIITKKKISSEHTQIETLDIRSSLSQALEENQAKDIIVNVTDFDDACAAIDAQVKMILDGTIINVSDIKTYFKKQIFLFDLAEATKDVFTIEPTLKNAVLNITPSKMSEKEALELLNSMANTQAKKAVIQRISASLNERRYAISSNLNINNGSAKNVNASYKDGTTLDFIKNNKGIHIINGQKGSGKTEVMIDLFKGNMETGEYPIFVNSSRALSESMIDKDIESVFYKNIIANTDDFSDERALRKGILGVVNTVFMNEDLKIQRMHAKTLIIDEIEEVLNHMSGGAIGRGKLEDQAAIFKRLETLINHTENVVLTDAMFSRNTLELISRMNKDGKKIYIHSQKSEHAKPVINYMSEAMNMHNTQEAIATGKAGVFCDGSHSEVKSKFNAVINSLKAQKKHSVIDADFMSDRSKASALKDKGTFSSDNDIIFYNSAAKCGLSIIDEAYKTTSLFACKTVSPNELIQASARLRNTEVVNLSFDHKGNRRLPLTPFSVMNAIMFKEMELLSITQENHKRLMNDEHVQNVVNRITYKNNLNNDYVNTTLILLDTLGYDVRYIADNEDKAKQGANTRRAGTRVEKEMRQANILTAKHIDSNEAEQIKQRGEHNSQENKNKLESFNIRTAYNVEAIDQELLKFDNAGRGRKVIANLQLLRAKDAKGLKGEAQIKKEMMNKLFEITGMNIDTFGKYSAHEADAFTDFVNNGLVKISKDKTISAKAAFKIAFEGCLIHKTSMKTVSGILKNMFNVKSPKNTNVRKQGKYIYEAEAEARAEQYYAQSISK
jgi:hypothetical protein